MHASLSAATAFDLMDFALTPINLLRVCVRVCVWDTLTGVQPVPGIMLINSLPTTITLDYE